MKNFIFLLLVVLLAVSCNKDDELTQIEEATDLEISLQDIVEISESEACLNSEEWSFTAYGNMACGGPKGYIAYSNNIDVQKFLNKVEEYTIAEKAFNKKWNVVSVCVVIQPPNAISCQNGKAIMIY